jgi:hypothetical protein
MAITIEPAVLAPRVVEISTEISSEPGRVKVLMEDVEDPSAIQFRLAGKPIQHIEVATPSQILDQYSFSFPLPPGIADESSTRGAQPPRTLVVSYAGRVLHQAELAGRGIVVG